MTWTEPYPVSEVVCGVCEQRWGEHVLLAKARARGNDEVNDDGTISLADYAKYLTAEICIRVLKNANRGPMGPRGNDGPPGPVGATGMSGRY